MTDHYDVFRASISRLPELSLAPVRRCNGQLELPLRDAGYREMTAFDPLDVHGLNLSYPYVR